MCIRDRNKGAQLVKHSKEITIFPVIPCLFPLNWGITAWKRGWTIVNIQLFWCRVLLYAHLSDNHKWPPWEGTMEWFSQNAHRKCNQETPSILWGRLTINLDTYCHVLVPHTYQYLKERNAREKKRPNFLNSRNLRQTNVGGCWINLSDLIFLFSARWLNFLSRGVFNVE